MSPDTAVGFALLTGWICYLVWERGTVRAQVARMLREEEDTDHE